MDELTLHGDQIELHQLLKATGLCATGGEAKQCIRAGQVAVDGQVELRLRRKVREGMRVSFNGHHVRVRSAPSPATPPDGSEKTKGSQRDASADGTRTSSSA